MSNTNSSPSSKSHHSHQAIIKSTSILSLGTLSSRILGFFRDIILAKLLGTGFRADAFFVALRIPNLFRELMAEGAANSAVIPVLAEYKDKSKEELWNFVSVVFTLASIILSAVTILGIIFSPWIVRLIAPGFMVNPEQLLLTVRLTKIMFPYLILIGLTAYGMGILFTFRSFLVPSFSPCLLNVAMIVSALIASRRAEDPTLILAIGVLIGGILQLAVHIYPILKLGIRYKRPESLRHPGAVKIGQLLFPRILGGGVYQFNVFIDTLCASLSTIVGPGAVSAIYYANRIVQFPMGIFSVSLAAAILPTLSTHAKNKDFISFKKILIFSLENIFFILCPTSVILLLLSSPIIRVLFQRGEFDLYSTQITSWALAFYIIGLTSFGGVKILVTAFYALQDTKTPLKIATLSLLVNVALNFILMFPLKVGGIALASSIAGVINFFMLFYLLDKKLGGLDYSLLTHSYKIILASAIVGGFEFLSWHYFIFPNELVKLAIIGLMGFIIYEVICLALKVEQAQKVWEWISSRKSAGSL